MSLVKQDCLMLLLQLFLFHLSIYSSINVSRPVPLSVRLSSLNKQTRSSCQLCPSPTPDLLNQSQPVLAAFQICNFLTHRLQSQAQSVRCGVVIETNMVQLFQLLPFYIIFQPSFFALCDFLSSISISFHPICHSTFVCPDHWSFCQCSWLNSLSSFCQPAK